MKKRKWITAKLTQKVNWWTCPSANCNELYWHEVLPMLTDLECVACKTSYKIVEINKEDNRILLEINNAFKG